MIKRYFSPENLKRVKKDFNFLVKFINSSCGEFDFAIRDNYFNIYYKGNSLLKVTPRKDDSYKVEIHSSFFNKTKADDPKFYTTINNSNKAYPKIVVTQKQLHPFLQKKHLLQFASNIKNVNNGEEINYEQTLITDNLNREDLIIIDRQVTDNILKRRRLDLLALKQVEDNKYKFVVLEVKLGNNKELEGAVAAQLAFYESHIKNNFSDYKYCYEKHYEQKKELGLFTSPTWDKINIEQTVEGLIIVVSYSGLAKEKIKKLLVTYPNLSNKIKTCYNVL